MNILFQLIKYLHKNFIIYVFLCALIGFFVFLDDRIRDISANRASMFISIDWLIKGEIYETGESPKLIDHLINDTYSSDYDRAFNGGLFYKKTGRDSYRLMEKENHFISLFSRDQLVSDSAGDPRYQSGLKVSK